LDDTVIDDEDKDNESNHEMHEEEEEVEEHKPPISKRNSSSSHVNVYTECGRHGDDWLFGGITDAVKTVKGVFAKSDKK
jgi:hypothetical protein